MAHPHVVISSSGMGDTNFRERCAYGCGDPECVQGRRCLNSMREFANDLDPDLGPLFGRDIVRLIDSLLSDDRPPDPRQFDNLNAERNYTHAFVQWKGTDVCLDFECECGWNGHLDAFGAYFIECGGCRKTWEMPQFLIPREGAGNGKIPEVDED